MSDPVNLASRRWKKGDGNPASHPAIEALEVAAENIRSSDVETQHIIVIYGGIDKNGAAHIGWTQAGTLDAFAQLGMLETCKLEMAAIE